MTSLRTKKPVASTLAALALLVTPGVGCSAPPSDGSGSGANLGTGGEPQIGGDTKAKGPNGCALEVGPGIVRRLTDSEYQTSLSALFGRADFPAGNPLTGNVAEGVYSTQADGLVVQDLDAQSIQNHATEVAEWAVATDPSMIGDCSDFTETCADITARAFGRRALRMPLSDQQAARYSGILMAGEDFAQGLAMMVSVVLQSPYFLYRRELGSGPDASVPLGHHELASELSYSITAGPPDKTVSGAADSGEIQGLAEWETQLERLLDSPDAEKRLIEFVKEWLTLKDVNRTKTEADFEVSDSLRSSMMGEVEALVRDVLQTGGGLQDLLVNDSVFVNAELAEHYGMAGPTGEKFEKVPAGNRTGGLLGTGAYLLAHSAVDSSSPTLRGFFIQERLLCQHIPPPPPSAATDLPPKSGPMTTRQVFAEHLAHPVCASCHTPMDNYGFAFENFDGLGRFRTQEDGIQVDTTGVATALDSGDVPFSDSKELVQLLADSEQVQRCFHQHLTEYVFGQANWDNLCSVDQVMTLAGQSGGSLRDSFKQVLMLPHSSSRITQGAL